MTETQEIWKEIPEFPFYDVSNLGNVRSWHKPGQGGHRASTPKILCKNQVAKYLFITLHGNRPTGHSKYIHQLVMLAFVGPCPDGMEVCHNNGNAADNRLENLRYDTHYNNVQDAVKHGSIPKREKHSEAKLTASLVSEIRAIYVKGQKPTQRELARRYNLSQAIISLVVLGKRW